MASSRIESVRRWTFFLGTCLTLAALPRAADAQEKGDLDTIAKAWQKRQDRVKSGRFVWTEHRTLTRGYQIALDSKTPDKVPVIPPTDVTYETPVTLVFQGAAVRYSYTDQWYVPETGKMRQEPYLCVFDGRNTSKSFKEKCVGQTQSRGLIKKAASHSDVQIPQLRPVFMTYQARNPLLRTYDIEQFALSGRRAVINQHSCIELVRRRPSRSGDGIVQLWVDPARDYVIVRDVTIERGVTRVQLDVQYKENSVAGWMPSSWKIMNTHPNGSGQLRFSSTATMTEAEFNVTIDSKGFDVDFPPETYVLDEITHSWYIVTPGGGKRDVPPEERSKTHKELLATTGPQRVPRFLWSTPGITVLIVTGVAAMVLAWRWLRSRGRPPVG